MNFGIFYPEKVLFGEEIYGRIDNALEKSITIDIPLGSDFQYRSDEGDLVFICITMPPWPGSDEVTYVERGAWKPSA